MFESFSKKIIGVVLVLLIGISIFFFVKKEKNTESLENDIPQTPAQEIQTIGYSVEGRKIEAYSFGNGEKNLLFVGGIHGGYEWNSVMLAYKFIDYLNGNSELIPKNLKITVIPSANPDGLYKITGKEGRFGIDDVQESDVLGLGRFNAHDVDLNRNFDCKWQPESTWRNQPVSAGTYAFSEPEAKTIQNFILENNPVAVIFWHSQSNAVYASECENGILPETIEIMNIYSEASGYPAIDSFDSYEVTGDAEGWLASIEIPAITVELKTNETIELNENLAGIKALFDYYKEK